MFKRYYGVLQDICSSLFCKHVDMTGPEHISQECVVYLKVWLLLDQEPQLSDIFSNLNKL